MNGDKEGEAETDERDAVAHEPDFDAIGDGILNY